MLKSRTEHYQGFWKDLDKKLQEYNCSLHVTEMTLRVKLYPHYFQGLKKGNA